jgi:hypothetical protein
MWFQSLPPCQAAVPCGDGTHTIRWAAGRLMLPSHPDTESERVLAALGADKPACVGIAEAWGRHTADLSVLATVTRGEADPVTVGWDTVTAAARPSGWYAYAPHAKVASHRRRPRPGQPFQAEVEQERCRQLDLLTLCALGPAFQLRLAGQVAAAHADGFADADRPAIAAALAARLGPVAERWMGVDPDRVCVTLNDGAGWGSLTLTGADADRWLDAALPPGWLAAVWACGLALVASHLVVAVPRPGWPDAQVLALPAPGAEPVPLDVHDSAGDGDIPCWEI